MYSLGLDIGSSSVKAALIDANSGRCLLTVKDPVKELEIVSPQKNWAEQNPAVWWMHCCNAIQSLIKKTKVDASKILSVGIAYQMHGLVIVDNKGNALRNAIIWCDGRAVTIGEDAFEKIGNKNCMERLLNSPGNFTASKLKWVKDNEQEVYQKAYRYMLPGDYIAFSLTGEINTTINGLSEGTLWDFKDQSIANWLLDFYEIDKSLTPPIVQNFSVQGVTTKHASAQTGLPVGIPITYRAGDQPNNALSLNVFNPGEVAATCGTSGVIYAISSSLKSKESTRINHFAHVNYSCNSPKIGKLLCINGAGITYRWIKKLTASTTYSKMNREASRVAVGSDGLIILPFGNGPERIFNNQNIGAHYGNLDFNKHTYAHLYRATLEGIAFAFVYGMDILKNDNAIINTIKAGNDNLFQSTIFAETIASLTGNNIEIYETTGAIGAARAASLSSSIDFNLINKNSLENDHITTYVPKKNSAEYIEAYQRWKTYLQNTIPRKSAE